MQVTKELNALLDAVGQLLRYLETDPKENQSSGDAIRIAVADGMVDWNYDLEYVKTDEFKAIIQAAKKAREDVVERLEV